ncbi:hypothetical protein Micbo1qcDRAFT_208188 [Microdochium bolleyi]|uniref:Uncharacterized protein n=1 Tax=Microdochium bolleyi TaxID=196109 RepID=A0A136IRJ8_9PEZI|nr:hypothetical protein Micbo1qcDRAFT_208188 [Microdochium bolleyi]
MPFDYEDYDAKCALMSADELQRQWNHYTRLISGGATTTTISGVAAIPTGGVSTIGIVYAGPAIHNARKKREIIDRHFARLGGVHRTRKRDVLTGVVFSGTVGMASMGTGSWGAENIMEHGVDKAYEKAVEAVTEASLGATGMMLEDVYMGTVRDKEAQRAEHGEDYQKG